MKGRFADDACGTAKEKGASMRRRRPGSIRTFAVLNLILGGLFLLCGLMNVGMASGTVQSNGKDVTQDMADFMKKEVPGYAAWPVGNLIVDLILAAGFIASGVGLLQVQGWGRMLAMATAGLSILFRLFVTFYQFVLVNPALERCMAKYSAINLGSLGTSIQIAITGGITLLVLAHNIFLFVAMLQPRTVRAFEGDDVEDEYPEDERRPGPPPGAYEDYPAPRPPPYQPRRPGDYGDQPPGGWPPPPPPPPPPPRPR
jgi:hypothetical protein